MCSQHQDGTKPFAAGLHAVPHGLVESRRGVVGGRQRLVEGLIHLFATKLDEFLEGGGVGRG